VPLGPVLVGLARREVQGDQCTHGRDSKLKDCSALSQRSMVLTDSETSREVFARGPQEFA
jgi:hypothetical protein